MKGSTWYSFIFCVLYLCCPEQITAQNDTRTDIPVRVYRCALSGPSKNIEKGQTVDVHFVVENYRKQQSPKTEFSVIVPPKVNILYGEEKHTIDPLPYKATQGVLYKLNIDRDYQAPSVSIEVWISNDEGILSPCYQATIRIGQTEPFASVTPITKSSLAAKSITTPVKNTPDTVAQSPIKRYIIEVGSSLNVRQYPSSNSKVVGTLNNGDYIEVFDIKDGWAYIKYNEAHAFISAKYIKEAPTQNVVTEKDTIQPPTQTVTAKIETIMDPGPKPVVKKSNGTMALVISMAGGFTNLYSPEAYSRGNIGGMADIGVRTGFQVLPKTIYLGASCGFALLGNSQYTFPYFSLNVTPIGVIHKLFNHSFNGEICFSLMMGGKNMYIYSNNFSRGYYANPVVAFSLKESLELSPNWNIGVLYLHSFNNVCANLPIGLHHSSIQIFASYKLKIK